MKARYNSYHDFLKERFGCRVNKVSVDMGFTCPNRDGSLARGGCVYCNNDSFVPPYARARFPMHDQITRGMEYLSKRFKAKKFIVYFQAYTNTYGSVDELERMYREALKYEGVVGIAVGTRSDCIDEEKLDMFGRLAKECYVSVEYGIESIYDKTLGFMNRGHDYESVLDALRISQGRGFEIGAHIIMGMPTDRLLQGAQPSHREKHAARKDVQGEPVPAFRVRGVYRIHRRIPGAALAGYGRRAAVHGHAPAAARSAELGEIAHRSHACDRGRAGNEGHVPGEALRRGRMSRRFVPVIPSARLLRNNSWYNSA
jgi:hypothetical protein